MTFTHHYYITGITETHLKTHASATTNINLPGYSIEHTPTESPCGGSLELYQDGVCLGVNIRCSRETCLPP